MLSSFVPGGILARILAQRMSESLGQ